MTCRLFFTLLLSMLALPYACKANAPEPVTDAAPVPEIQDEVPAVPALDEPEHVVDQSAPAPESVEAPANSAPSTTTQQPSKSDDFIYDATAVQAATSFTP